MSAACLMAGLALGCRVRLLDDAESTPAGSAAPLEEATWAFEAASFPFRPAPYLPPHFDADAEVPFELPQVKQSPPERTHEASDPDVPENEERTPTPELRRLEKSKARNQAADAGVPVVKAKRAARTTAPVEPASSSNTASAAATTQRSTQGPTLDSTQPLALPSAAVTSAPSAPTTSAKTAAPTSRGRETTP